MLITRSCARALALRSSTPISVPIPDIVFVSVPISVSVPAVVSIVKEKRKYKCYSVKLCVQNVTLLDTRIPINIIYSCFCITKLAL